MLQSIYWKNKSCKLLYYNTNTTFANYNQIFHVVKILKEICVHNIEPQPVLLTVEDFF